MYYVYELDTKKTLINRITIKILQINLFNSPIISCLKDIDYTNQVTADANVNIIRVN